MLLLQLTFLCVAFGSVQAQGEECWARRISLRNMHAKQNFKRVCCLYVVSRSHTLAGKGQSGTAHAHKTCSGTHRNWGRL